MTHQVLIASYKKDFPWLKQCLRSLKRFQKGFLPPAISVSSSDYAEALQVVQQSFPEAVVVRKDGKSGFGNMRAQISMMSGDVLCPNADVVYLVGSDCFFFAEFTPEQFMRNGKPLMLHTSYTAFGPHYAHVKHWQEGTTKVLGIRPEHEFMRRLPLSYPKALFPAVRRHIETVHRKPFEQYCYSVVPPGHLCNGGFSESNILGAFAWRFMPHLYHWILTDNGINEPVEQPMVQFWSHGPMTRPTDAVVTLPDGSNTVGRSPLEIITGVLGSC